LGLTRLKLSMVGTLTAIIAVTTLFISSILYLIGSLTLTTLVVSVVAFNVLQWLIAPYLIDAIYRVRQVSPSEMPELHRVVSDLSERSGIRKPMLMFADIPIPNAFAYGSPIAGTRVAVTRGLIQTLDAGQVEAVVGHELGHIKHRDVQVMMLVSVLPAICYVLARSFMFSGYRDRELGSGLSVAIGALGMLLYSVLTLLVLNLSRLREYFADRHSTSIVEDGARKLSEGLAVITAATSRMSLYGRTHTAGFGGFKTLFISDPDTARRDYAHLSRFRGGAHESLLVEQLRSRELTLAEKFLELFSTHPNIVKRLRALQALQ